MKKKDLCAAAGISHASMAKLGKNQEVNLSVLLHIAEVMDCNAGDMMDFIKESNSAAIDPKE